jgi:hypothetical protein
VYKVEYEFSGMKAPGLALPQPEPPIIQPQNSIPTTIVIQPQTPEEKLAEKIALLNFGK